MYRNVDLNDITDGSRYGNNDMVRADTYGCKNCSFCCRNMCDTIFLDPFDVFNLLKYLSENREAFRDGIKQNAASNADASSMPVYLSSILETYLKFDVADGVIMPRFNEKFKSALSDKNDDSDRCPFLDKEGRCSVHSARPGFCRLFPLGRLYENGSFSYILQTKECKIENRGKIKVRKWLGIGDLKSYEAYIVKWHYFLEDIEKKIDRGANKELAGVLDMKILQDFYLTPYAFDEDFYAQFYERLEEFWQEQ